MAATTLADETPLFSAGLTYVLTDISMDSSLLKFSWSPMYRGVDWCLVEGGSTYAETKRLIMHLSDNIIREEGSALGGSALWDV